MINDLSLSNFILGCVGECRDDASLKVSNVQTSSTDDTTLSRRVHSTVPFCVGKHIGKSSISRNDTMLVYKKHALPSPVSCFLLSQAIGSQNNLFSHSIFFQ